MYCSNCGKEISELVKFCPFCGTQTAPARETPVEETPVQEAPVQEMPVQETPAQTAPVAEAPAEEAPAGGVKKLLSRIPKKWLVAAVAGVVLVGAVAAAVGGAVASVASPQKQLLLAYAGAVSDITDVVAGYYDDGMEIAEKGSVTTGSVEVNVTELVLTQALEMDPGINSVKLEYEVINDKSGKLGCDLTLASGKTELLTVQAYVDTESREMVVAVPEVLSKPVTVDLGEAMEGSVGYDAAPYMAQTLGGLTTDFLPEGEFFETLLPELVKTALLEIDEVERSKTEFTASGVTQEATCLTVSITEVTLRNMANAVLEELKTNKDIKKILTDFYKDNKEQMQIPYESAGEFYDEYVQELTDAQEELSYYEGDAELCRLYTWVNKDNEILAVQLIAGEVQLFAAKAADGSDVGLELSCKEAYQTVFAIKGSGTEKSNKFSGTLTVFEGYDELFIIECEDVNTKKLEEGYLSGSFRISLGEAAREEVGAMASGLEVVLTLNQSEQKASAEVEVILQGTTMGTLTMDGGYKLKGNVKMPSDAVPVTEMGTPNLEIIMNRLKAAGVNEQLVDQLGQMLFYGMLG